MELTSEQWHRIEPIISSLTPSKDPRGSKAPDPREVMERSFFSNVRIYNRKTMIDKRKIFIIPPSIAFFVLITLHSFASADHDESIVIQKACGISGLVCSNKSFESKQIERFFTKVIRKNDDLNLKTLSGPPIILSNKKAKQESLLVSNLFPTD